MASKNILIAGGTSPASPTRMGLDGDAVITSDGVMKNETIATDDGGSGWRRDQHCICFDILSLRGRGDTSREARPASQVTG